MQVVNLPTLPVCISKSQLVLCLELFPLPYISYELKSFRAIDEQYKNLATFCV